MKKCLDCNEYMREARITGSHPHEKGLDGRTNLKVHIPTGEKGEILGMSIDKSITAPLKARICPKCGKIQLFVDQEYISNL